MLDARPEVCTDEMLTFLDDLRESGITNMFGAGIYLEQEFPLSRSEAKEVLLYWMRSFSVRKGIA